VTEEAPATPPEPSPEIDPLQSLKEADRRRGGCGAFLVGAVALVVIATSLILITFGLEGFFARIGQAQLTIYGVVGALVAGIAGGIRAANLFTRLRVRRMDRIADREKNRPIGPTST
jgi:hypothetical protein